MKNIFILLCLLQVASYAAATGIAINNCATLNIEGATYILTSDILNSPATACLNILANNVTLDCMQHRISGLNLSDSFGVVINGVSGVTVKNCVTTDWYYGIISTGGNDNTIQDSSSRSSISYGLGIFSGMNNKAYNMTVTGAQSYAFMIWNSSGSIIKNVTVRDCKSFGFDLWNASYTTITDSSSYDNTGNAHGFILDNSKNNMLNNITAYNNMDEGIYLYYSDNNKINNATTYSNNYSGMYLYNSHNNTLNNITTRDENYSGIILHQSDTNTLRDARIIGSRSFGLNLWNATGNIISGVILHDTKNSHGVLIDNSDNNTLNGIETYNNEQEGIYLYYSDNNRIRNATTYANNFSGMYLYNSGNNILGNITTRDNNISGFIIDQSDSNTVTGSKITGNNNTGILIYYSADNTIYNNYFKNSKSNYVLENANGTNDWNTTKQTGTRIYSQGTHIAGNYWASPDGDGYSETCNDADGNGFCDLGYQLATDNIDYVPLSNKYGVTTTTTTSTTTTTMQGECPLVGDSPPCGDISIAEVVAIINKWSIGQATIQDVVALINAWAGIGPTSTGQQEGGNTANMSPQTNKEKSLPNDAINQFKLITIPNRPLPNRVAD